MKLLQKTTRNYSAYSVVILLVLIPVFYFSIQNILRKSVDESLLNTRKEVRLKITDALKKNNLEELHFIDQNISVSRSDVKSETDSLSTEEIYDSTDHEFISHRILRSNVLIDKTAFSIIIKTSLVENDDLLASIVRIQMLLLILLLGGLLILNKYLSKKIWSPFYITLGKLGNYSIEKDNLLKLTKSTVSEFNDLNKSLEELTTRTYQAYTSQKEFTENASHEMQTPLAVLQSKLELLMQTFPLTEEQARLIDQIADFSQKMTNLNKSLILLTKIENNQFSDQEEIYLQGEIDNYLQLHAFQLTKKNITVEQIIDQDIIICVNKTLIQILIANLLTNSIRHNNQNGIVIITMKKNILTIQNTGKAFPLDHEKIFKRFQKQSIDAKSIGIGLELAKKICKLYNYLLEYNYEANLHGFTIYFKGNA